MPILRIETNRDIDPAVSCELALKGSKAISAALGKPEQYVLVSVHPDVPLSFGGSLDPAAWVELKSIGLDRTRTAELATLICDFLQTEANIPPERTFIEFKDLERDLTGWDGKTL